MIGAVAVVALVGGFLARPRRVTALRLLVVEHTLPNGLHVVLSEDHSAPTVGVTMVYRVGARDETPGQSGIAHVLEHLMFEGSENVVQGGHSALISSVGGLANASTTEDFTQFYQTVPANQLPLALFLESDRLRSLRIGESNLDNVRRVVSEERRSRGSNQAYGRTRETLLALVYDTYGYQHPVVGSSDDVDAITPELARAFRDKYYVPSNAVLTIVGDFREDSAMAVIHRYFDAQKTQPTPVRTSVEQAPRTRERRQLLEDPFAPSTRIDMAYVTPGSNSPDQPALELAALILGEGESARLNQSLVRGAEVASAVFASPQIRMGPSMFWVGVQVRQEKPVEQAQLLLDSAIAKLQRDEVSPQELKKAKLQSRRALAASFETTVSRALKLGTSEVLFGSPTTVNTIAPGTERVTGDDIRRVARTYLTPSNRVVVVTAPSAQQAVAPPSVAERPMAARVVEVVNEVPRVAAPLAVEPPSVNVTKPAQFTLANGLSVLVVENHRLPQVLMSVSVIGAGPVYDTAGTVGLAALTADMLPDGTTTRTGRQIADQIEEAGAAMLTSAANGAPAATVQISGLSDNFEEWLPIVADVVQNPRFPSDELNARRKRMGASVQMQHSSPKFLAQEQLALAVFGSHPASRLAPSAEALDRMDAAVLKQWHRERFVPQNATVAIVGDVDAGRVRKLLEQHFGKWVRTEFAPPALSTPAPPADRAILMLDRPGSSQAVIMVGGLAVDRRSPDYPALLVLDRILGGEPASRLGFLLRQTKGYAYEAQSTLSTNTYAGSWRAWADVRTGVFEPALSDLLGEVQRMSAESVSDVELQRAKRSLVATFAVSLEQPSQVLSLWVQAKRNDFSDDYWDSFPQKLSAVSATEVLQVARKYYDPARFQLVVIGDGAVVSPSLAKLGPVKRVEAPR